MLNKRLWILDLLCNSLPRGYWAHWHIGGCLDSNFFVLRFYRLGRKLKILRKSSQSRFVPVPVFALPIESSCNIWINTPSWCLLFVKRLILLSLFWIPASELIWGGSWIHEIADGSTGDLCFILYHSIHPLIYQKILLFYCRTLFSFLSTWATEIVQLVQIFFIQIISFFIFLRNKTQHRPSCCLLIWFVRFCKFFIFIFTLIRLTTT